jgi:hypothetical protein|tara:strand:+ start:469 stop:708 length:240 start_codon:yes stop_codon:yes gene_type:complete
MENQSNVNAGVVVLSTTFLQNTTMNGRLDIEDNIGEGIHIHYKNFRFDLTIKDFIKFAKACDTSLHAINEMNQKGELDD